MKNKKTIEINGKEYEKCCKNLVWRPIGTDINSIAYIKWVGAVLRTLDENARSNIAKWYKEVILSDNWIYFDAFEDWHKDNYIELPNGETICLDKDLFCNLLGMETKIYSAGTCCYLPVSINNLLTYRQNDRAKAQDGTILPCNVHEYVGKKETLYYGFVRLGKDENGKELRKQTKRYKTIEEAWQKTLILKRSAICDRAEEYKPYLKKEVYQALLSYMPPKY